RLLPPPHSFPTRRSSDLQRSFHDLSYRMDLLHDRIGTTLAMDSNEILSPQLVEIWRLTSEAQADVGQLPLSLLPFNKTEEFLSRSEEHTSELQSRFDLVC